jgi:HK97 gp10 family phage protein
MAIRRVRGPVPRVRAEKFGGGSKGSKFSGYVSLNTDPLERLERSVSETAIEGVLKQIGDEVIAVSQPNVPVLTGELKSSDFVEVDTVGNTSKVDFGYSANHAAPVEYGTGNRAPKPYLRPAYDEVVGTGKATEILKDGLGEIITRG